MSLSGQIGGTISDFLGSVFGSPVVHSGLLLAAWGMVILWAVTALWALRDAASRTHNVLAVLGAPTIILAATPVGFPFAVLVWRILRPQRTMAEAREQDLTIHALRASTRSPACPGCHSKVSAEWRRCPWCRTWLMAPCPRCERLVELTAAVCPWCIADLAPGSLVPQPGPAMVPAMAAGPLVPVMASGPMVPVMDPALASATGAPLPGPTPAYSETATQPLHRPWHGAVPAESVAYADAEPAPANAPQATADAPKAPADAPSPATAAAPEPQREPTPARGALWPVMAPDTADDRQTDALEPPAPPATPTPARGALWAPRPPDGASTPPDTTPAAGPSEPPSGAGGTKAPDGPPSPRGAEPAFTATTPRRTHRSRGRAASPEPRRQAEEPARSSTAIW